MFDKNFDEVNTGVKKNPAGAGLNTAGGGNRFEYQADPRRYRGGGKVRFAQANSFSTRLIPGSLSRPCAKELSQSNPRPVCLASSRLGMPASSTILRACSLSVCINSILVIIYL